MKKYRAVLKLTIVLIYLSTIIYLVSFTFLTQQIRAEKLSKKRKLILSVPYKIENVNGYGNLYKPIVEIPVKFPDGYKNIPFLLDSGATITSLSYEFAEMLKVDLSKLPRISIVGYGNTISYSYKDWIKIKLGEEESLIPVLFTENIGTKNLLGRHGFFDLYSIDFNHIKKSVDIYK